MPESPNESFRASASSTLNPTPLSSTASLTLPSAELREMFTLLAAGVLADVVKAFLNQPIDNNFGLLRQPAQLGQAAAAPGMGCSRWKRFTSCRRAAPRPSCSSTAGLKAAISRRISRMVRSVRSRASRSLPIHSACSRRQAPAPAVPSAGGCTAGSGRLRRAARG